MVYKENAVTGIIFSVPESESIIWKLNWHTINNRIKMVIEPFANADMTKVFHIVTGVDTQHTGDSK